MPVTREDAIKWDDERGILGSLLTVVERRDRIKNRMKQWRENTNQQLALLKTMLDCFSHILISACHDSRCCDFCRVQDELEIQIKDCTPEMLPPFSQCENEEDGCRCYFIALTPEMHDGRRLLKAENTN